MYPPHQRAGRGPTAWRAALATFARFTIYLDGALHGAVIEKGNGIEKAGESVIALDRKTTVNVNRRACTARIGDSFCYFVLGGSGQRWIELAGA